MKLPAVLELFAAARSGVVHYSLLHRLSSESSISAPELLDELEHFVAKQYFTDQLQFDEADKIMNAAWSLCVSEDYWADHDRTVPEATREVFEAFDAGEYSHAGDDPSVDPEVKYTKPLIAAFLASHSNDA
jgi:hypothetical protein